MPGLTPETLQGREEHHKVQWLLPEHLRQTHTGIHLGLQARHKTRRFHIPDTHVTQHNRTVHHPVDGPEALPDKPMCLHQRRTVRGIRRDIHRRRTQHRQPRDLRPDTVILSPATQPDHLRLVVTYQSFAPHLAQPTGTPEHHVHAPVTIDRVLRQYR